MFRHCSWNFFFKTEYHVPYKFSVLSTRTLSPPVTRVLCTCAPGMAETLKRALWRLDDVHTPEAHEGQIMDSFEGHRILNSNKISLAFFAEIFKWKTLPSSPLSNREKTRCSLYQNCLYTST